MVWTFISFHLLQEWRKYHSNWAVHNFLFKRYEIYLLPIQKRLFYWKKPNRDHNSNRPFFINDTFGILNAKRPSRDKIKWWQDFSMHGKTNLDPQSWTRHKLYSLILPRRSYKQLLQWIKSFFPMGRSLNCIPSSLVV